MSNPQYDYEAGPDGPMAPLHARAAHPKHPSMISPPFGWIDLVLDLNTELATFLPDYTIFQVKEKFAGLRFYIHTYGVGKDDPRIELANELIQEAEVASFHLCQVCGSPGEHLVDGMTHATLCEVHAPDNDDTDETED